MCRVLEVERGAGLCLPCPLLWWTAAGSQLHGLQSSMAAFRAVCLLFAACWDKPQSMLTGLTAAAATVWLPISAMILLLLRLRPARAETLVAALD